MRKFPLLLWLSAIFTTVISQAQTIDAKRLDSLFDALASKNLAMGIIAITQNGKTVYQRSVGKDESPTTTYRIGSITKVFTAVLIYELIDEKKLSLQDSLSEFFPDIANAGKITIEDMLGHRSGLANFTATSTGFEKWKGEPHTHEQLLAFIKSQPPDFAPGAKADYNNSNFLLLGYILENIYHKPYKDIVTERIVHKLGLQHTYYGDHAGYQGNEATSFKYFDNQWQPEKTVYLDNFGGAGAMISTPSDLCALISAIFDGKFISRASVAHMTHMEKDWYGWGMFSFGDSTHQGYGHNGQTEGFASSLQYYSENKLAMAYCTNGEVYPKDFIMDEIFKICFHEPVIIPTFAAVPLTKEQLNEYTGEYEGDNNLHVVCSVVGDGLTMEVKSQPFILEALSDHLFRNVRFGFFFEFDDKKQQLIIHDAATAYWLHKTK